MNFRIMFLMFLCSITLMNCKTNEVLNNKSIGILLFSYPTQKNLDIPINLNKWQLDPAYKKYTGDINPIYWGGQDSQFKTKPLLWGVMNYKNRKQFVVLDNQNQLWFDQDGEFDNIPYNVQLEMTTKSSKTNLYKTYGPYPLNSVFPLFIDDYSVIKEDSLVGQIDVQLAFSRIIKANEENSFCVLELILN